MLCTQETLDILSYYYYYIDYHYHDYHYKLYC